MAFSSSVKVLLLGNMFPLVACSQTTAKHVAITNNTTYSTSTQQLQSVKIPDSVFQMTNLRHLSIGGMDCDYIKRDAAGKVIVDCWAINEIPAEIKNLKKLQTLALPLNNISKIPIELGELTELNVIDFTDNSGVSNIDNLTKLTKLEKLLLYGCNLKKLPVNIGDLRNLKFLGLTGNDLDEVEKARIKRALPNCEISF